MSNEPLINIVQRIERLNEQKQEILDYIKEIYAESKSKGYENKVIRALIRKRAQDAEKLKKFEELLDMYENAIQPLLPLGLDASAKGN